MAVALWQTPQALRFIKTWKVVMVCFIAQFGAWEWRGGNEIGLEIDVNLFWVVKEGIILICVCKKGKIKQSNLGK